MVGFNRERQKAVKFEMSGARRAKGRREAQASSHAKDPAAAKALLDYLASSPEAAGVYKEAGMELGH